MKHRFHLLFMILYLSSIQFSVSAQEDKEFDLLKDNIESMLPPLENLIDSAIAHNPSIKTGDMQTRIKEYKLKSDRDIWAKNLGIQTDVRYGTFDNFSMNAGDGQSPSLNSTRGNQLNYGIGGFIKIPIYDIVNRKNQIRSDKLEIEQAQNFAQTQKNEIRQLVIKQYNELILKHRVLVIKLKNAETSKINMQLVEKGFQNGIIPITQYASQSEAFALTEIDIETSRMDFKTAYMILEEIVVMKFNLIKTIPATHGHN